MRHTFFGGVFPATHKESTRRKPIAIPDRMPEEVVIPLMMCSSGSSEPIVHPGDKVTVELSVYDLNRGRITYRFK